MDCRDVDKLMDPFFDRQLDESSADEVRGHLAACNTCRRRWGGLHLLLSNPEPVEVPDGLRDRILIAWEHKQTAPIPVPVARGWRLSLTGLWYAGAIAACVLFFVTGWLLSGRWDGSQPATVASHPDRARPVTVVVSPWILSSMAQAAAMPAPVNPAVMLASGVVPEMVIAKPRTDEPMIRVYQRPAASSASQPETSAPDVQLLPLVPRYLGA